MPATYIPIPYAIPYASAGFQAGVIQSDGRPFIVGSFQDYRFALKQAHEYALDMAHIAHARANRSLALQDLRQFTDAQLCARRRFLNSGWADKLTRAQKHAQAALVTRVQNERGIISGAEVDGSDALDNRGGEVIA